MAIPGPIKELLLQHVEKQRNFRPTVDKPSPSSGTGDEVGDLAAVIAGRKPAAIIKQEIVKEWPGQQLLVLARERKLAVEPSQDLLGRPNVVVGRQPNVERIVELTKAGKETQVTTEYHRRLGKELGYPEEAIREYLGRLDQRQRRGV